MIDVCSAIQKKTIFHFSESKVLRQNSEKKTLEYPRDKKFIRYFSFSENNGE